MNAGLIKIILELAVDLLRKASGRRGVVAIVLLASVAVVSYVALIQDGREMFVRRSAYMIGWYCDNLTESDRMKVRELVNDGSRHVIVINCNGDRGGPSDGRGGEHIDVAVDALSTEQ